MNVIEYSQKFTLTQCQIESRLSEAKSWEERYRTLMLIGKELGVYPIQWQQDTFKVQGCESNVWLQYQWQDKSLWLAVGSDAKIVKGLVAIVLAVFNGKTAAQIAQVDIEDYLNSLQLMTQLSPSRANGLHAIIEQIKSIAGQD